MKIYVFGLYKWITANDLSTENVETVLCLLGQSSVSLKKKIHCSESSLGGYELLESF